MWHEPCFPISSSSSIENLSRPRSGYPCFLHWQQLALCTGTDHVDSAHSFIRTSSCRLARVACLSASICFWAAGLWSCSDSRRRHYRLTIIEIEPRIHVFWAYFRLLPGNQLEPCVSKTLFISRVVSLLVALGYASLAYWHRGRFAVVPIVGVLCLGPLALIWFPQTWTNYTGGWGRYTHGLGRGNNYATTPPLLLSIAGWCLLLLLAGLYAVTVNWKILSN